MSDPLGLPVLKRSSLRDDATRILRARITAGELESGRLYAIGDIANQLGVSPTPVREALLDLANQGLIEMFRNRGFKIVELSSADLDHIVDVRIMLEPPAMRKAAQFADQADFPALRQLTASIETAAAEGDLLTFLTLDKTFHLTLLGLLGNERLVSIVGLLRDQTRLSGLRKLAGSDTLVRSAREHDALLDAIESGDGRTAERVMAMHLKHVGGLWAGHDEDLEA